MPAYAGPNPGKIHWREVMRTVLCLPSLLFLGTSRLDPVAAIHPDSIGAEKWASSKLGSLKLLCVVLLFCAATAVGSPAQTLTTLHAFAGYPNDGSAPNAGLVQATDGNFYGTTYAGGTSSNCQGGCGTVFRITPGGTLTTLHSFDWYDGASPTAALVQGTDGNFYGTTYGGGANQYYGTVFKITPGGTFTSLYSFCAQANCADGSMPYAGLVQGTDGNFYGTTLEGGSNSGCSLGSGTCGTVFKITPAGTLTTLYNFCAQSGCADGGNPYAGLVQASDGNFYGTTFERGANGYGTVFKITPAGTLTTLYSFCSQTNCADGQYPYAGLVQATDGNFYGSTSAGGGGAYHQGGTVFKITPSGTLTTIYNFCSQPNCTDGAGSVARLLQASDGNLYGTTLHGGAYCTSNSGCGTVFRITPSGTLTTLHSFDDSDGKAPFGGLVQATDGNFYGAATYGANPACTAGLGGCGTVFRLSVDHPVQFIAAAPCRVVDTRNPNGPFGGPVLQGNSSRSFPLPQSTHCNIPASAAYSLNVTVVPRRPLGYLTIWPTGQDQPLVSTLNSPDGRVKANAAIVPAGTQGAVSVYVTDTTDVIIDIDGYFATPGQNTYAFYPLTPCRVIDTRGANGDLGGPYLHGKAQRDFPVLESPCLSGLNQPQAYSFNFTVAPHSAGQPLGYLTVWPEGQDQPVVSTLNNPTGTVVANAAIVPAGTGGGISTYAYDDTDLIVDINGYFAAAAQGGLSLYPIIPCRAYDSRNNNGKPFQGTRTIDVVDSQCGPSVTALAYVFNATVVPDNGPMGYLTLWAHGQDMPVVSTLNAYDGYITSNLAIVPTTDGSINAYADGLTQLILDISGYFAP